MKKIIAVLVIIFLCFIIYQANAKNLIDYMIIGDSITLGINSYGNNTYGYNDYLKTYLENNDLIHNYNNLFCKSNYKIEELTNDIKNNKNILYKDKTYNIRKTLRESDLLTLSIGMDELVNILDNNDFNYIKNKLDEITNNMDKLLEQITKFSKANIILIGYYNPSNTYTKDTDRIFAYLKDKYQNLSKKYNINYIDIYNIIKENKNYLPNKNDYHLTSKGYLRIAKEIIEKNNF